MDAQQLEEYRQRMRNRHQGGPSAVSTPLGQQSGPPAPSSDEELAHRLQAQEFASQPFPAPVSYAAQEVRPLLPQPSRSVKKEETCLPDSSECWGVKSSYIVIVLAMIMTAGIVVSLLLMVLL